MLNYLAMLPQNKVCNHYHCSSHKCLINHQWLAHSAVAWPKAAANLEHRGCWGFKSCKFFWNHLECKRWRCSLMSLVGIFSLRFWKWFLLPDMVHEHRVSMPNIKELVSNWLWYDLLEVLAHAENGTILGWHWKIATKLSAMENEYRWVALVDWYPDKTHNATTNLVGFGKKPVCDQKDVKFYHYK